MQCDDEYVPVDCRDVHPIALHADCQEVGDGQRCGDLQPRGEQLRFELLAVYDSGTMVTLTATPGMLSVFNGWDGCDTVSGASCTVSMSAAKSVTASFMGVPLP